MSKRTRPDLNEAAAAFAAAASVQQTPTTPTTPTVAHRTEKAAKPSRLVNFSTRLPEALLEQLVALQDHVEADSGFRPTTQAVVQKALESYLADRAAQKACGSEARK